MKTLIFWFIALVVLFHYLPAQADNTSFKYGLGVIEGSPTSQVKSFAYRYEESEGIFDVHTAGEIGLWTDTGTALGRKGSSYGKVQVGIRPEARNFYAKAFWGLAAITGIDSQLGGMFPQFALDTGFGFQSQSSFIGINFCHISSASLYLPNKGRDFLSFEMGIKW